MSRRSSRSSWHSGSSRITADEQINELASRLQLLLPQIHNNHSNKMSAAKVLQETCNYIRNLHEEVDNLSERLSELLETTDTTQADFIRNLLSK
ncbi:transcription factor PRE3-like [Primulina eburnea]|uniref:transcription factor PRE3-like n=1 Tax=Primulina eburnea TaxID=1245227 RepID=UPI003C6C13E7